MLILKDYNDSIVKFMISFRRGGILNQNLLNYDSNIKFMPKIYSSIKVDFL